MTAQNLVKRLVKELQRGGKRTAVLGLLLLGGLYVWVPMVWKAILPPKQSSATATATATNKTTTPAASTTKPSEAVPETPQVPTDWRLLHRRLDSSPVLQPVALDELARDPFNQDWIREKKTTNRTEADPLSPNDPISKLICSATLVSDNGGVAVIGDEVYRLGDEVPSKGLIRYILKEIGPEKVVLERAGNSVVIEVVQNVNNK